MRTEFLCVSVLRVALGPRVLASCKSALNPPVVCSTDPAKAVVPVLVLLFVALWFIPRGDLLYVFPCVILFLCFSVLLVLRLPRLGTRELILVLFVRLFGLCLFGFVGFLFLLVQFVVVALPGLSPYLVLAVIRRSLNGMNALPLPHYCQFCCRYEYQVQFLIQGMYL